ncbi:ORF6N domain-containing protein [Rhodopseudomonas parapalustris]
MNKLMPMEYKNQRIVTTDVLADSFGTDKKIISNNFNRNIERFVEGKHYYMLQGEALKDFKGIHHNDESLKFVSVLYLWTDRGAARHAKILDTDEAWEVYEQLEETYFNASKPKCIEDVLIAQLQEMKDMRMQVEIVKQQAAAVEEKVENMKEVIEIRPSESWRDETNTLVKKIGFKLNDYQKPKEEIYKALQERASCDLKRRLDNMRARAILGGTSKSKANAMNFLDVISEDKKLVEIYTAIVKEMSIKHGVA